MTDGDRTRRTAFATCLAMLVLAVHPSGQAGPPADAETPGVPGAASQSPIAFEGVVFEPGGAPAPGAVVVSSAGGDAVTDGSGAYRLETQVPYGATRIQLTAVGASIGSPMASVELVLDPSLATVQVAPLSLLPVSSCQSAWLPVFGIQPGASGEVRALAVYDDGRGPALYAGGFFRSGGEVAVTNLARWDGEEWTAVVGDGVAPGNGLGINAMVVHDDGGGPELYVAGHFPGPGLFDPDNIAKWDGTTWSRLGAGTNGPIYCLAVYDDGQGPVLYAGGDFSFVGSFVDNIARWNGNAWSGVGGGTNGIVRALAVHDDGTGSALYVGGQFNLAGGVASAHLARWNGATWSSIGAINSRVFSLAVYDDGSGPGLYAGGSFTMAGGVPAKRIARWDGRSWSPLGAGIEPTVPGTCQVRAMTVFDDGHGPQLCVAGVFPRAGGLVARSIARWDGASWSSFGGLTGNGFTTTLGDLPSGLALTVFDVGTGPMLVAGGAFEFAGERAASCLARYEGSRWRSLGGDGPSNEITSLTVHDDGRGPALYAGGTFLLVGEVRARRIARWSGAVWEPLGEGLGGLFGGPVYSLASFDDGDGPALYAGVLTLMKWNGASWTEIGGGLNGGVVDQIAFDDGSGPSLFVGGSFTFANASIPINRIAKWDGASWSPLGAGVGGGSTPYVFALEVFDDGTGPALYAGGNFMTAGGLPASRVARWDGANWSALGEGLDARCNALAVFDDGTGPALFAGGIFTTAGGQPALHVAKWDGVSWSPLGAGLDGDCLTLFPFDDGTGPALYAGGRFRVAGGFAANGIARWDGSHWKALSAGVDGDVSVLGSFDGDGGPALFVGGSFPSGTEIESSFLAKWGCRETTPPTLTFPEGVFVLDPPSTPPGEVVHFVVKASDDQDPTPTLVCDPPSGSLFPRGTTLVTCTAIDGSGNRATARFPVTVEVDAGTRGPIRR